MTPPQVRVMSDLVEMVPDTVPQRLKCHGCGSEFEFKTHHDCRVTRLEFEEVRKENRELARLLRQVIHRQTAAGIFLRDGTVADNLLKRIEERP